MPTACPTLCWGLEMLPLSWGLAPTGGARVDRTETGEHEKAPE